MKNYKYSLIFSLLISIQVNAANYYVSPKGNNSNGGTKESPWKTLQYSVDQLTSGDILYLLPGTYNEFCTIETKAQSTNPIKITTEPGDEHLAILDGTGVTITFEGKEEENGGLIQLIGANNIIIENIKVKNSHKEGIIAYESVGIKINNVKTFETSSSGLAAWFCQDVLITGSTVENACLDEKQEFITVSATSDFEVTNCFVENTSNISHKEGIDVKEGSSDGSVNYNRVIGLAAPGIYIDAWTEPTGNVKVYNNLVWKCNGIALASEGGGTLKDIDVYNNVILENYEYGIVLANWGDIATSSRPIQNVKIYHNTILNNGLNSTWGGGISLENKNILNLTIFNNIISGNKTFQVNNESNLSNTGIVFGGNLVYGETNYSSEVSEAASLNSDPLLVGNLGFEPSSSSPVIDAAIDMGFELIHDFSWIARNIDGDKDGTSQNDIGAIEYQPEQTNSMKKPMNNNIVEIYPNPFTDQISINKMQDEGSVEIFSIKGELIHRGTTPVINTSDWPIGLYIVHNISRTKKSVVKIVKH
jgi:small nuclear ribonucleoprotein (snRNP)-like protein